MNEPFTPQATPLYAVDILGRVHLVVGWCNPDHMDDSTWWNPVTVAVAAGFGDETSGDGAYSGPLPSTPEGEGGVTFATSLEMAKSIATAIRDTGNPS